MIFSLNENLSFRISDLMKIKENNKKDKNKFFGESLFRSVKLKGEFCRDRDVSIPTTTNHLIHQTYVNNNKKKIIR